jgi:hypothetical protein
MNREIAIKEILERIIEQTNKLTNLSKTEIDKAIILSRGIDPRTITNWFNALWKLEYLTQPMPGSYSINLEKAIGLEIPIERTHTQILEKFL